MRTPVSFAMTGVRLLHFLMSLALENRPVVATLNRLRRWRPWRVALSTRVRILGGFVLLMGVALLLGLFVQRFVLIAQMNSEVNAALAQEIEELQRLSQGRNPATGEPFGTDVSAIFDTFLSRNIPVEGGALFALIDGEPYASTVTPFQLFDEPEVVAEWANVTETTREDIDTEIGRARYLAAPIEIEGETRGVFIVTIFLNERLDRVDRVIRDGAIVFGSVFVGAAAFSWFVAGRVLRPVSLLTKTARGISESNWSERIPTEGDDEIARLAQTFNDMLDRLQAAFHTQRRFIDDAGHELRTPITIIRGHLELLGDDPREREEVVRIVTDELDRMTRIVEDLLLLAKAEQPDFLQVDSLDTTEFTRDIAAKARILGDRQWVDGEAAPTIVPADRQRLTQAMMNLVRNAIEHTREGGTIEIGSRLTGNEVWFWVRDDGEGIPAEVVPGIFERFSRGDSQRNTGGAGLGLAIVKAIAVAHHGRVLVESSRGRGATFTLALPIAAPGEEAA